MPQSETRLSVGDYAPDFTLTDLKGNVQNLTEMLKVGSLLLFFFRGTWCPSCRSQMKTLEANYRSFQRQGVQIAGIAHQRADIVASYFRLEPLSYPYLLDSDLAVITNYGLLRTGLDARIFSSSGAKTTHPAALLIDQQAVIRWLYIGSGRDDLPPMQVIEQQVALLKGNLEEAQS